MRIDWLHEKFESGLELWDTEFRGMHVEIRREIGEDWQVRTVITAGSQTLHERMEQTPQDAMVNSLKWINGYWDEMEDGPNVRYQAMELPDELQ